MKHEEKPAAYLGDGLYYQFDGFQVRLFASNGVSVYNEVFLELPVLRALLDQLKRDNLTTAI